MGSVPIAVSWGSVLGLIGSVQGAKPFLVSFEVVSSADELAVAEAGAELVAFHTGAVPIRGNRFHSSIVPKAMGFWPNTLIRRSAFLP